MVLSSDGGQSRECHTSDDFTLFKWLGMSEASLHVNVESIQRLMWFMMHQLMNIRTESIVRINVASMRFVIVTHRLTIAICTLHKCVITKDWKESLFSHELMIADGRVFVKWWRTESRVSHEWRLHVSEAVDSMYVLRRRSLRHRYHLFHDAEYH